MMQTITLHSSAVQCGTAHSYSETDWLNPSAVQIICISGPVKQWLQHAHCDDLVGLCLLPAHRDMHKLAVTTTTGVLRLFPSVA